MCSSTLRRLASMVLKAIWVAPASRQSCTARQCRVEIARPVHAAEHAQRRRVPPSGARPRRR